MNDLVSAFSISLAEGTVLHDRYRILSRLGSGGFSITYTAHDQTLDIDVVVKEYLPKDLLKRDEGTTEFILKYGEYTDRFAQGVQDFMEEARTLAKLIPSDNIAAVIDYFAENNTAYIIMPYYEGDTLEAFVGKHGGRISIEQTLELLTPIMKTLHAVHQKGIVHRDISPDNIIITKNEHKPVLLDFGICSQSLQGGSMADESTLSLKTGYSPPEQYIFGGEHGAWSDVYAMAATIWFCLSGNKPAASVNRMRNDTLPGEIAADKYLPRDIKGVLQKALNLCSKDRHADMDAFCKALKTHCISIKSITVIAAIVVVAIFLCVFFADDVLGMVTAMPSAPNTATAFTDSVSYKVIQFADPNLEAAIRTELDRPTGDILVSEVLTVQELHLQAYDIQNLDGLQYFLNLIWVDLSVNLIEDLTPLTSMYNLINIQLQNNMISDLTPLESMTWITDLNLCYNYIRDIGSLANLENLTWLDLNHNRITDVSSLENLQNLKWLNVAANYIEDISCLANLPQIEELSVGEMGIEDVSVFDGHSTLVSLTY